MMIIPTIIAAMKPRTHRAIGGSQALPFCTNMIRTTRRRGRFMFLRPLKDRDIQTKRQRAENNHAKGQMGRGKVCSTDK